MLHSGVVLGRREQHRQLRVFDDWIGLVPQVQSRRMPRHEEDVVVRVRGREPDRATSRLLETERHELVVIVLSDRLDRRGVVHAIKTRTDKIARRDSGSPTTPKCSSLAAYFIAPSMRRNMVRTDSTWQGSHPSRTVLRHRPPSIYRTREGGTITEGNTATGGCAGSSQRLAFDGAGFPQDQHSAIATQPATHAGFRPVCRR